MPKSQQSLLQSQHPPTQWNEAVLNKLFANPAKTFSQKFLKKWKNSSYDLAPM
jgi:hypothetical protein